MGSLTGAGSCTNNHVIEGAARHGRITRPTQSPVAGTVIGTAPERELAVIASPHDLVPLRIGAVWAAAREACFAVGFPLTWAGDGDIGESHRAQAEIEEGPASSPYAATTPRSTRNPAARSSTIAGVSDNTAACARRRGEVGLRSRSTARCPDRPERRVPRPRSMVGIAMDRWTRRGPVQIGPTRRCAASPVTGLPGPGEKARGVGDVIVAAGGSRVDSAAALTKILSRLVPGDRLELELIDTAGPRLVRVVLERRRA